MAGIVMFSLIGLMIVTLLVMLVMRKGKKRILLTFAGFLVAIGLLHLYVVKTCGPNTKDVELMTPQAEAITKYILEHGLPESMKEIPNLPYPWDRCKRESSNVEWCFFDIDDNEYRSRLYFFADTYIWMKTYNKKSETGISSEIIKRSENTFEIKDRFKSYSTKNNGICDPLKQ